MSRRGFRGVESKHRWSMAVAALLFSFGAIALGRAHDTGPRAPALQNDTSGGVRQAIETPELNGFVAFTQGALLENGLRELFAEVRLAAHSDEPGAPRPVALAVALDTSGSMTGAKIQQARDAVEELIRGMRPIDRVAVITYDHEARVLVPLMPAEQALHRYLGARHLVRATGGTNIPAGLQRAEQALALAPRDAVRRRVLISDGRDGSGLQLRDVTQTIRGRAREGVTTSALGVGVDYEEAWLSNVADAGRGNYEFLASGVQLSRFLGRELAAATSTVVDQTELTFAFPPGWRITESYGASVVPGSNEVPLGALSQGERRRVTLRLEVAAGGAGSRSDVGVGLRYRSVAEQLDRNLPVGRLSVSTVAHHSDAVASRDPVLHAEAAATHLDALQALAVQSWRDGDGAEAQRMADDNTARLQELRAAAPAAARVLDERIEAAAADRDNFGNLDARTTEGRAYGLGSNASRRQRARTF
ncbi:MAG: VWA domain-containing protein [Sandaracinaceae bacterium]